MPKLNFYDTDAVKAFVLNILVENEELRSNADYDRRQADVWFQNYQEQKERTEAAEAKAAAAKAILTTYQEARQAGVETGERDTDRTIADALALLNGGESK